MRKFFNTTGSCDPDIHYMVDTTKIFLAVKELIDRGEYFTINRARQFGKTTMLDTIWERLSGEYIVIPISFEGVGDISFSSEEAFVKMFSRKIEKRLSTAGLTESLIRPWKDEAITSLDSLSDCISLFCKRCRRKIVVTIDEVDKSSDNQTFLSFLGMLRNKYLSRKIEGKDSTFHCVILAGVYDIKNLKIKLRPSEEKKYNSPWNIAADFTVDMSFHPDEIAHMLSDYENDVHTGMDIVMISQEIYKYTNGYPFLVSYICKIIDEQLGASWNSDQIISAVKIILEGNNTLIDDLSKNLENNPDLRSFLYAISVNNVQAPYNLVDPIVKLAAMFSYIRNEDGKVRIHNLIFEESIYYYFTIAYIRENSSKLSAFQLGYTVNGRLDMEHVISRFADLMHQEYRDSDVPFLEREGRLVFLSFLKPIINGTGFYYVEPQTRNNNRMDIVVTYGGEEHIIELKIWRGDKYENDGKTQLAEYLSDRNQDKGYLVTFDFSRRDRHRKCSWQEVNGKQIFEAVI